jgi:hypothetical protein
VAASRKNLGFFTLPHMAGANGGPSNGMAPPILPRVSLQWLTVFGL